MAAVPHPFRSAAHRADLPRAEAPARLFPLLRWFALLSAVAILFVSITGTLFLGRFVERTSLLQSADGLAQVVNGIVEVERADPFFFRAGQGGKDGDFAEFLAHLGKLPGVLRANVYGLDGAVLWSSDASLVGRRFPANQELDAALAGLPVASAGTVGEPGGKTEHARLGEPGSRYVENYLPVWSTAGERRVIGAVEVYRQPMRLLAAIRRTQQRIWWGAVAVAALLYLALFAIVARAACLTRRQQGALVAAEQLATASEMASAVAHGLRNPLASIRSTAELGLEIDDPREARALHAEVVAQADRLEGWIRQFLTAARAGSAGPALADVGAVIAECADQFAPGLARRGVALEVPPVPDGLPRVRLCAVVLRQVLNSLLANAVEAMADGGRLSITTAAGDHRVTVEVGDTGPGMSAAEVAAALAPFATTKPAGLGLGLPLARETVERHGGRLVVESRPGAGTTVRLVLPAARDQATGTAA